MFKWLKRLLGTEITDSVTAPPPVADVAVAAESVAATAETAPVATETKAKRTRAKKAETGATDAKPKRTARSTPPKQAKVSK